MNIGTLTGEIALEDQLSGQLTSIITRVKNFASTFDGAMLGITLSATTVVTAISGVAASIVNLGEKGSVILGVEESFDRLARSIGSTGEELFSGLNEGVKGTIDSMVLMQSTTRLLSSGVKLTADDMRVMGATAREMGKATGTDAADGLNTLSAALLTGQTRALRRFGINIDLIQSERDFAKSLGVTRDQLNDAGRTEARRIAILDAMRTKLDTLGTSQLSFKERVQQTQVAIGNWFDDLAKGVARSTAVSSAFDAIKTSIVETFGADAQAVLSTILQWVDDFADGARRIGPIIINAIGNVKSVIMGIWKEIVAFNDRWKITENLVSAARFAWTLLKDAFNLVRTAVDAVNNAWAAMPDWLRQITHGAIEGTAALAVYSTVISGLATPIRSLASTVDLAINIFANLSGFVFNIVSLTGPWNTAVAAVTTRYTLLTAALARSTVATTLGVIAIDAITLAQTKWMAIITATASRLGILTAAEYVSTTATGALAAVKSYLGGVVLSLSLNYNILVTRLGLTSVAMGASRITTIATTTAMTALGTALLAVQYVLIPVALAWAGWKLGEWLASFPSVQRAIVWLAENLHIISTETANAKRAALEHQAVLAGYKEVMPVVEGFRSLDPAVAALQDSLLEVGKSLGKSRTDLEKFVSEGVKRFYEFRDSGMVAAASVATLDAQLRALGSTPAESALRRLAGEAAALAKEGATLTPELAALVKRFDEAGVSGGQLGNQFLRLGNDAEEFEKKVKELLKSYRNGDEDLRVFTAAFGRLSEAQRSDYDLLQRLVPEIVKLERANRDLTPAMEEALAAHTRMRIERNQAAASVLGLAGVTKTVIDAQIAEGKTLEEVARGYSKNSQGIRILVEDLNALTAAEKAREDVRNAALAKAKKDSEAAKGGFNLLTGLKTANVEAGKVELETDTETAIRKIKEANQAILDSHEATGAARVQIEAEVAAKQKREIDSVLIDQKRVKDSSIASLQAQLDKTRATLAEMTRVRGTHTDAAIRDIKREERAQAQALEGMDVDYAALNAASKTTLNEIARTARNTYEYAATHSGEFSKKAIKHFKDIAEAADREARGVRSAWETTYDALGDVASILDNIPGKFAEIASVAARAGQAIMKNLAEGDWIGAIVSGATAVIDMIGRIAEATRDGRHALEDYFESFEGGADGLQHKLEDIGRVDLWNQIAQVPAGNLEAAKKLIGQIEDEIKAVDDAVSHYNLTTADLVDQQRAMTKSGKDLALTYDRLVKAGYSVSAVQKAMSKDINQFIIDSVRAGTKIPAAMRPVIESMAKTGTLTDQAAKAILGLADTSMPSLEDIRSAAERYGITLDELGGKVKQLEITELANQYVADWELLSQVTDNWGVLFDKMGPKVQDLINDAIRYGAELPSKMRPMIQAWIDQGRLVDETGEKLTDLSKLTFAADLSEMFEDLMTKLDELIDKISGGVGGALDRLGSRVVNPRIDVSVTGVPSEDEGPDRRTGPGARAATGGTIYAATGTVVPFAGTAAQPFSTPKSPYMPKGTDTVPAMLTPGEIVLNATQQKNIADALSEVDDDVMRTVRNMIDEIERLTMPKVVLPLVWDTTEIDKWMEKLRQELFGGDSYLPERRGDFTYPEVAIQKEQAINSNENITQEIQVFFGDRMVTKGVAKGLPKLLKAKGVRTLQ